MGLKQVNTCQVLIAAHGPCRSPCLFLLLSLFLSRFKKRSLQLHLPDKVLLSLVEKGGIRGAEERSNKNVSPMLTCKSITTGLRLNADSDW